MNLQELPWALESKIFQKNQEESKRFQKNQEETKRFQKIPQLTSSGWCYDTFFKQSMIWYSKKNILPYFFNYLF